MNKAVFLDRDGLLIENVPTYVREWSQVEIFEGAVAACRRLDEAGFLLLMVTNQAGIGRGIVPSERVAEINGRLIAELRERGAPIAAAYVCPHTPDDGCDCRKPKPGMLFQGAREHGVDLGASFMVGDSATDMQAAAAAGVVGIMVRTGQGREQEANLSRQGPVGWRIVEDLQAATDLILRGR